LSSRLTPIEQSFSLQNGQSLSLGFTPTLEDANYLIYLKFDKAQTVELDCPATLEAISKVQWSLQRDSKVSQTHQLRDSTPACNETSEMVTINFSAPELILHRRHFLHLSVVSDQPQNEILQSRVSIAPFGIGVHYAYTDLAFQELAGLALLIVGFGFLLPDIYYLIFRAQKSNTLSTGDE
jgi:hypothetical protein